jgi:hypothetical protein
MSLSESEKELLLSASLDGALSDEEQETLDRWLSVDPAAVKRREEMEAVRRDLRLTLGQLRSLRPEKLGAKFADAIVTEAIARAKAEELSDDHPLLRIDRAMGGGNGSGGVNGLGGKNAGSVFPSLNFPPAAGSPAIGPSDFGPPSMGSWMSWPRMGAVAALAASLLIAVLLYRNPDDRQLADRGQDDSTETGASASGTVASKESPFTQELPAAISARSGLNGESAADAAVAAKSADPTLGDAVSADSLASGAAMAKGGAAMRRSTNTDANNDTNSGPLSTPLGSPNIAMRSAVAEAADSVVMATEADVLAMPAADGPMMLSVVMVVSIELTPSGRQSLALLQALRESDIRMGADGVLSDQVLEGLRSSGAVDFGGSANESASAASTSAESSGEASRLYYVEAPAKQIDQFLMRLMADSGSVASIGLSVTDEPAVLASISGWAQPETDDEAAVARDLVAVDGNRVALAQGDAVIPLPRDDATGMETIEMLTPPDAGDAKSQLLLIVR